MRKQFETFNIFSEQQIATSSIHIQIQSQKKTAATTTTTMNVVVIFPCVSHSVGSNLFSGNMLSVNQRYAISQDTFPFDSNTNYRLNECHYKSRNVVLFYKIIHDFSPSDALTNCYVIQKLQWLHFLVNLHWNCYRLKANIFDFMSFISLPIF